ncbi:toprim domain-containing protein [Aureimonas sp. AU22]|uniref:toprim domain-containing protein n=1 Tax=Aureimonas sp. AU22 TaxID=1638162 RepID=UPI0007840575|nr:toprim domain-containing protein [Aureimonas sp. AU22]
MRFEPLKERCKGRWQSILPAVGIASKFLRNTHGPCPMCGGKDRFRFDDKGGYGTWFCGQCDPQSGDGIEIVKKFLGLDFKAAAARIEPLIGTAVVIEKVGGLTDKRAAELSSRLWRRAKPITAIDPAGIYLSERCGLMSFPECLRYVPDERYTEDKGKRPTYHHCMVARMIAHDDSKAKLHRTYLTHDGLKAPLARPRVMMPGETPVGSAVRLMPCDDIVGIAEGIETALSASRLHDGIPVWAALTAHLLENWIPPASVQHVMIFGDNDASNTGQAAAFGLAKRLTAKGVVADVCLPPFQGHDWNDEWVKKGRP